jgi:hypothetical protein
MIEVSCIRQAVAKYDNPAEGRGTRDGSDQASPQEREGYSHSAGGGESANKSIYLFFHTLSCAFSWRNPSGFSTDRNLVFDARPVY